MRLWSLHPKYLDAKGLVALWRETLLAKAVLQGKTRGYRRHPQLARWRETRDPVACLNAYLAEVYAESVVRGYRFDWRKVGRRRSGVRLKLTRGQLDHEWTHLLAKLRVRDPVRFKESSALRRRLVHPSFRVVPGPVAPWERVENAH
jgi:hypothetical protein